MIFYGRECALKEFMVRPLAQGCSR